MFPVLYIGTTKLGPTHISSTEFCKSKSISFFTRKSFTKLQIIGKSGVYPDKTLIIFFNLIWFYPRSYNLLLKFFIFNNMQHQGTVRKELTYCYLSNNFFLIWEFSKDDVNANLFLKNTSRFYCLSKIRI